MKIFTEFWWMLKKLVRYFWGVIQGPPEAPQPPSSDFQKPCFSIRFFSRLRIISRLREISIRHLTRMYTNDAYVKPNSIRRIALLLDIRINHSYTNVTTIGIHKMYMHTYGARRDGCRQVWCAVWLIAIDHTGHHIGTFGISAWLCDWHHTAVQHTNRPLDCIRAPSNGLSFRWIISYPIVRTHQRPSYLCAIAKRYALFA